MCSNCNNVLGNNMNSFNNPNLSNGTIGLAIENGNSTNTAVLTTNTNPFNNGEVLNTNIFNNNNSCGCNFNGCNCNNSCECNCNGNNNITANSNDNDNVTNNSLQRNLRNFIGRRVTLEFNNSRYLL